MKTILILSVALIVIGEAVLGYDHYSYATKENIIQIGPITATAELTNTKSLPPIIGWLLIGGGAFVLAFAALSTLSKKNLTEKIRS
jgi:tellurite resistance protein TehA-like permease